MRFPSALFYSLAIGLTLSLPASAQEVLPDGSSVDGNFSVDNDLEVKNLLMTADAAVSNTLSVTGQTTMTDTLTLTNGGIRQNSASIANIFRGFISLFDGRVCAGNACDSTGVITASDGPLRLRSERLDIVFDDVSGASDPDRDWRLLVNDFASSGIERFSIRDETTNTIPFTVEGGAPNNALWVDDTGNVGIGTMFPQEELHLVGPSFPAVRFEQDTSGGNPAANWRMQANHNTFSIVNNQAAFSIGAGAPSGAFSIAGNGDIGMNANVPGAPLHIRRTNNTSPGAAPAGILVEDASTLTATRGLLTLRNNGRAFFALEDTSIPDTPGSGRQWNFQNRDGEFAVTTSPGGTSNIEMRLDSAGNMRIKGNFFAQNVGNDGTQIAVPDYVFAPDYDLKPLSEVAAFIAAHSHLPEVPSAAEITETGLNMTEMQMTLLKKIEELTLYTLEQQKLIEEQARLHAMQIAELRGLIADPSPN